MQGVFITIEGSDGAGKTTLIKSLKEILDEQLKCSVLATREPGGNVIAEKIRNIILDKEHITMDAKTEALLYAAARRQHLVDNLLPALQKGECILCDRFVDSSIAYQGGGRQLGEEVIASINAFATDNHQPDLTLYIDIPVEIGLSRIHNNRSFEMNRLDLESMAFHERVNETYKKLAQAHPERICVLNGIKQPNDLVEEAVSMIKEKFSELFKEEYK